MIIMKISNWLNKKAQLVSAASEGAMIALMAPPSIRKSLSAAGLLDYPGADKNKLHVTLLYLGKADQIDQSTRKRIAKAVEKVCSRHAALQVKLGGLGKFSPGPDGSPLIATVDCKGLNRLQADLENKIGKFLPQQSEHGYLPHLTLGYLPQDEDQELPQVTDLPEWKATEVSIVYADKIQESYSLAGDDKRQGEFRKPTPPVMRPGLIIVYRGNPVGVKTNHRKGWWFTVSIHNEELDKLFVDLTAIHSSPHQEGYRFKRWDEKGYQGWWTLEDSSANAALSMLEVMGWDVVHYPHLPFVRKPRQWSGPPDRTKERFEGDYWAVRRSLMVLLNVPVLEDPDRERLISYWKTLTKQQWLSQAQVDSIVRLLHKNKYYRYLKRNGITKELKIWTPIQVNAPFVSKY
jgi:2'-5' RNA ligase